MLELQELVWPDAARRRAQSLVYGSMAAALIAAAIVNAPLALAASSSTAPGVVSLSMSGPDAAQEGAVYPLTLTVRNNSAASVLATGFFADIPNNVAARFSDFTGASCRTDQGVHITCSGPGIGPGASASMVVNVIPASQGTLTVQARGSMETSIGTWVGTSGGTSLTVAVGPAPTNLSIKGTASTKSPAPGAPVRMTYQIKNGGSATAYDVTFTDALPAELSYVAAVETSGQGICTVTGQTVSCSLGVLSKGGQRNVAIDVLAPLAASTVTSVGTVAASVPDTAPADNSSAVTIQVR